MPLDPIKLHRITESDFDRIIASAGGKRIDDQAEKKGVKSADYLLGDVILELKIVEEEGLEKPERQTKIGSLFREQFPEFPVVVIDPYIIQDDPRRKLFRILEGPMKTLAKKASKQLAQSAEKWGANAKVLIIFNNGYMSLQHEDFEHLVLKCVRNDTRNIDLVIVGGMYFHYDGFDHYMIFRFEHHVINASTDSQLEALDEAWSNFVSDYMNESILKPTEEDPGKAPAKDISFNHDGITFVRPRPQVGQPSSFFIRGRPRENSTGIEQCPPVATVVPVVPDDQWETLRKFLDDGGNLPLRAVEWLEQSEASEFAEDPLEPTVPFSIGIDGFPEAVDRGEFEPTISDFKLFACDKFSDQCRKLADDARDLPEQISAGGRFILVETVEIGSDKAYDFSSISLVSEIPGFENENSLLKNGRIFFEHALCLGAAYAVKHSCSSIFTRKNTDFGWI